METSFWRRRKELIKSSLFTKQPPSTFQIFRAIILFRWASLVLVVFLYFRGVIPSYINPVFLKLTFLAVVLYNLFLTLWSQKTFEFLGKSLAFVFFDILFSFTVLTLTSGWGSPYFLYTLSTLLLIGLYGTLRAGFLGALIWSIFYFTSLQVNGFTISKVATFKEVDTYFAHFFDFFLVSLIWSYLCGLASRLNEAYFNLKKSEEALSKANKTLSQRQKEMLALHEIGKAILSKSDVRSVLEIALNSLKKMGFSNCRIWLLEEDQLKPFSELDEETNVPLIPLDSGALLVQSLKRKEILNVGRNFRLGEDDKLLGFKEGDSFTIFPFCTDDEVLGVMVVERKEPQPLSQETVDILRLFVDQIALALQHIRLYERMKKYAVAEERSRIAAEIHDTVLQNLYGASFLISSLRNEELSFQAKEQLEMINNSILKSLKELRFALLDWESLEWDEELKELVKKYVTEFSAYSGIPVNLSIKGKDEQISSTKSKDLLRILQEALSNVWRHAEASRVQIGLSFSSKGVSLSIEDDGKGFDPKLVGMNGSGRGLRNIKVRAKRHGGRVFLKSSPQKGTCIRVWIPY